MESYTTIGGEASDEFEERRSRFIGTAAPVSTPGEAEAFLAAVRARYKDARHHVYAYLLRQGTQRFSDDGEPQGTGGKPVLEVLTREGVTDLAVVVTRYFGGVLLGAGGLTRAYAQGAKAALDAAQRVQMCLAVRVELDIGYDFYGQVTHLLPNYGVITESADFGQGIRLVLRLREQKLAPFSALLRELSGGTVFPLVLEQLFASFDD